MELILKETISSLGFEGDVVTVKDGYGRNYLLPQGKAVAATAENLKILEENKAAIEARRAADQKNAEAIAKKISGIEVVIEQLAGDDERLFGSVSNTDICAKLAELDVKLDKRQILLADPIKTLGDTSVTVKVGFNVSAEISVKVVPLKAK
ncbi:50S ribosomal protein L9 [Desulforhopalus singaporensis]|uniref:Large ribosomal subunit protein bL9 n=1 Tax=Desulforhopalus singaporensis TaxID=91360 RepID=A0A1H0PGM3_9BACT|nr:50S ribosomal protein L9 [Desulforhopalus singaporensis]SDP03756.1 LSU ribosomal protein L9P [Desulforhopalus singaporensis]